jgi:hypothetical protein
MGRYKEGVRGNFMFLYSERLKLRHSEKVPYDLEIPLLLLEERRMAALRELHPLDSGYFLEERDYRNILRLIEPPVDNQRGHGDLVEVFDDCPRF